MFRLDKEFHVKKISPIETVLSKKVETVDDTSEKRAVVRIVLFRHGECSDNIKTFSYKVFRNIKSIIFAYKHN